MLDGASRVKGLMQRAAELEMPALAITDHGVMFGAVDFYKQGLEAGVKPIIGTELYMAPGSRFAKGNRRAGDDPYYHLTLLAETQQGYRNLMKLVSRAYLEGYWYKPRADKELLAELSQGLICLSGCLGAEVNQLLLAGRRDDALAAAAEHRDIFGPDSYFIELQDHGIADQHRTNGDLIWIAEQLDLRLVVTNDSHYTHQSDFEAHDALLCIQTGSQKSDENRFRFSGDQFYVKPAAQMHALFPDHPQTWKSTLEIGERCDVTMEFGSHHLPSFECPRGMDESTYLRQKVYEGAIRRYGLDPSGQLRPDVTQRLDYELGVIEQMGFPAYFLIVADLCDHAREVGIRVGPGRGSAAGCAVAYCTGITDLDPIAHGLIFERFLNPERVSMPDIDMDFDERRRGEMIRYARDRYGEDRVAQIVTFSTIKAKQAIKDSARVLGYPYGFGDRLAKMMPPPVMGKDKPLAEARRISVELATAWENEPDARKVLDTALSLEGLRRQHSIHAAGVVIGAEPITEHCPVLRVEADGEIVTQYDGGMVEDIGLLKMDFLGLRNLTVITDALTHIKATTGEDVVIEQVPLDDPRTYKMLADGDTDGVFQLDSAGMKSLCRLLRPDAFDDIVALIALYRPGPMSAGLHTEYAERKHGRSKVRVPHPDLMPILESSYGILVYQEQVLEVARVIAGFTLGEADMLRRAIGKKKPAEMEAQKAKFLEGTVAQGYERKLGQDLWDLIEGFADYAFNKSHSAGYGLVSYQTAWLKANYPVEYMAALLTSVKGNKDRLPLYLNSCRMMGIEVLQPDVNASELDFAPAPSAASHEGSAAAGGAIRFGLSAVRNVGEQVVESIIAARRSQGAFTDFVDFVRKVDGTCLNKRTVESLIKAGAFESLGTTELGTTELGTAELGATRPGATESGATGPGRPACPHPRKGLLMVFEGICDQALATKRAESEGQFSLFGGAQDHAGVDVVEAVAIPDLEFDRREKLVHEREMLGLYVSDHPLLGLEQVLADAASTSIGKVVHGEGAPPSGPLALAGILTGIQRKFTKRGEAYVVGTLEDLQSSIDVMFFPATYATFAEVLVEDALLCVKGRLDDGETPKLIAADVSVLDTEDATGSPLLLSLAPQQCTAQVIARLKSVLGDHPGVVPVHLRLVGSQGRTTTLRLQDDLCVTRAPGLYAELKMLLGPHAVA